MWTQHVAQGKTIYRALNDPGLGLHRSSWGWISWPPTRFPQVSPSFSFLNLCTNNVIVLLTTCVQSSTCAMRTTVWIDSWRDFRAIPMRPPLQRKRGHEYRFSLCKSSSSAIITHISKRSSQHIPKAHTHYYATHIQRERENRERRQAVPNNGCRTGKSFEMDAFWAIFQAVVRNQVNKDLAISSSLHNRTDFLCC